MPDVHDDAGVLDWIDSHCHLDAAEFDASRPAVLQRCAAAGVHRLVLPAVCVGNFNAVRELAHASGAPGGGYALGIHPLYVGQAGPADLQTLAEALQAHRSDPLLLAVGEIGLDHFVPGLDLELQQRFYIAQLKLARDFELPLILHVRRSADALLAGLRRIGSHGGIAHAFNGSLEQAQRFVALGFRLGFGGAMTFERALQIRRLAAALPADAVVLETDAPDIPPQWLYRSAAQRAELPPADTEANEPAQLPRIAQTLAALRGWSLADTARITVANTLAALPRLAR